MIDFLDELGNSKHFENNLFFDTFDFDSFERVIVDILRHIIIRINMKTYFLKIKLITWLFIIIVIMNIEFDLEIIRHD